MNDVSKSLVEQQVERCIECYGTPIDADFSEEISRQVYEQMRADMMIMVGIVSAMLAERLKP